MTLWDIMREMENQTVCLEKARAVLLAATEEVEDYKKYERFRQEHAVLLLTAADDILYRILPELNKAASELMEKHKVAKQLVE